MRVVVQFFTMAAVAMAFTFGSTIVATEVSAQSTKTVFGRKDTIWDHNGSEMLWKRKITGYTISYLKPRPALAKLGIQPGTVLFKGIRLIKSIKGNAFSFRKGCGTKSFKYRVRGNLLDYKAKGVVLLKGQAPIIRRCKLVGHKPGGRDGELKFTFMRKARY